MTTNEKLIVQLAKNFINAYWNVPFHRRGNVVTLLEYISMDEKMSLTLDTLLKTMNRNFILVAWIVEEIIISYEEYFKFLGAKYLDVVLDGYGVKLIKIDNKFLSIEDGKVVEYKQIMIPSFKKVR